jgi:O-antigen ligase
MIVFGALVTVAYILYFLIQKLKIQPEILVYFAWIIWALSGIYTAIDPDTYWLAYFRVVQMGMMIFTIAGIMTFYRDLSPFMVSMALGCITIVIIGYLHPEFRSVIENAEPQSHLEISFGLGANEFAYYLLFVIFVLFYFWDSSSTFLSRLAIIVMAIFPVAGIIYSHSRKSFLGIFAFILLWYFFCHFKRQKRNQITVFITLVLILSSVYFSVDYVLSHTYLGGRFLSTFEIGSDQMRLQMYEDGFRMIEKNPLLGVGLNQFRLLSVSKKYSHSDYIEVAANTGIIGFILYFSFYVIIWVRISRLKKMIDDPRILHILGFLKAAIITILLIGFGRPNINSKLTWIFLAGVAGYTWSMEKKIQSNTD